MDIFCNKEREHSRYFHFHSNSWVTIDHVGLRLTYPFMWVSTEYKYIFTHEYHQYSELEIIVNFGTLTLQKKVGNKNIRWLLIWNDGKIKNS